MDIDPSHRTAPEWNALWTLFGAYLNQDVSEDYGDPWSAVAVFRDAATSEQAASAASAARRLADGSPDDERAWSAAETLGLEYRPVADGHAMRAWLRELADVLDPEA